MNRSTLISSRASLSEPGTVPSSFSCFRNRKAPYSVSESDSCRKGDAPYLQLFRVISAVAWLDFEFEKPPLIMRFLLALLYERHVMLVFKALQPCALSELRNTDEPFLVANALSKPFAYALQPLSLFMLTTTFFAMIGTWDSLEDFNSDIVSALFLQEPAQSFWAIDVVVNKRSKGEQAPG